MKLATLLFIPYLLSTFLNQAESALIGGPRPMDDQSTCLAKIVDKALQLYGDQLEGDFQEIEEYQENASYLIRFKNKDVVGGCFKDSKANTVVDVYLQ